MRYRSQQALDVTDGFGSVSAYRRNTFRTAHSHGERNETVWFRYKDPLPVDGRWACGWQLHQQHSPPRRHSAPIALSCVRGRPRQRRVVLYSDCGPRAVYDLRQLRGSTKSTPCESGAAVKCTCILFQGRDNARPQPGSQAGSGSPRRRFWQLRCSRSVRNKTHAATNPTSTARRLRSPGVR